MTVSSQLWQFNGPVLSIEHFNNVGFVYSIPVGNIIKIPPFKLTVPPQLCCCRQCNVHSKLTTELFLYFLYFNFFNKQLMGVGYRQAAFGCLYSDSISSKLGETPTIFACKPRLYLWIQINVSTFSKAYIKL